MMSWNKEIYIANRLGKKDDGYGNKIITYQKPIKYMFNVQPVSSDVDLQEFGEKASRIQNAIIPREYEGVFHENDLAYLDGASPKNEIVNGNNANYRLYPPRIQNLKIAIYFERLTGK